MREVAKSMFGLSWAVSLFGLQQLSRLVTPESDEARDRTVSEVDDVSRAIQSHLSGTAADQFRTGDEWQRRLVDTMFDMATMRSIDPRAMVDTGMSVVQKSFDTAVETMRQTADGAVDAARRVVESMGPTA